MKFSNQTILAVVGIATIGIATALEDNELCLGTCTGSGANETCVFKFSLDIHASSTGYYRVEGCEGTQPTLGMKEGVLYTFDQTDETNWFHPLGFAYGPDGVYADNAELEKGVPAPGGADCSAATPCQYPQYKKNGEPLCDNPEDCDVEDFGLDQYEGVYFSGGRDDWLADEFTVDVTITDPATTELFYFCHIHNRMSGRIKVLDSEGKQKKKEDVTPIPYEYEKLTEFDEQCGTFNMSQYADAKSVCPEMTFLCSDQLDTYGECMVAIDCAMHVEMRVSGDEDPTTTFMHQMIAHHRNAVNMAKILLKENPASLQCGTAYDGRRLADSRGLIACEDGNDEGNTPIVTLLWEIINGQNAQITLMESWLKDNNQISHDYCEHKAAFPAALVGVAAGGVVLSVVTAIAAVALCKPSPKSASLDAKVEEA